MRRHTRQAIGRAALAATTAVAVFATGLALTVPGCSAGGDVDLDRLRGVFPAARRVTEVPVGAEGGQVRRLTAVWGPGGVVGYVADAEVVSRSGPFRIRVILDSAARVRRAWVTRYVGRRGRQVKSARFTDQFIGKGPGDALRVGRDIDAVTGATLSSRAMAGGVRQAVRAVERLAGRDSAPR